MDNIARNISRRSLSAEESRRFVQLPRAEDVVLGGDADESSDDSHAGNGFFSGLLLQRSQDYRNSRSEDERLANTWLVMAKVSDRGGRFLTLIDESEGRRLYLVLEESAVLEHIRSQFEQISSMPGIRKKPRHHGQGQLIKPYAGQRKIEGSQGSITATQKEIDLVQDDDSSAASKKTADKERRKKRDEHNNNRVSTPEPSVASHQSRPAVTTPEQEDTKIQEVVVSSARHSPSAKSDEEKKEQGGTTRMIVKQLRALHQEVAGLKQDRRKLYSELLNLRDECGLLNRSMMENAKERSAMYRDIMELRKTNQALADIVRNRSPTVPTPSSHRSKMRPELPVEEDLEMDLVDLKRRLQEQQRLTETLLGDSSKSPPSRESMESYVPAGLDRSQMLMGVLGGRSPAPNHKRRFSSDVDLNSTYMSHLSGVEKARQATKRQKEGSPWS